MGRVVDVVEQVLVPRHEQARRHALALDLESASIVSDMHRLAYTENPTTFAHHLRDRYQARMRPGRDEGLADSSMHAYLFDILLPGDSLDSDALDS